MEEFSHCMNQSHPIFGHAKITRPDSRKMAIQGYITPIKLNLWLNYDSNDQVIHYDPLMEDSQKEAQFVENLIHITEYHDEQIIKDSKGRRRAFMFVTCDGNGYLAKLTKDQNFLNWAKKKHVGVYITSCMINDANNYEGGGYIKKAGKDDFEYFVRNDRKYLKQFKINEFLDILKSNSNNELALTNEDVYSHINILVNIDQLNTGVNLPALNGVYIARYLDKNDPRAIQVPGRAVRADKEDNVGDEKNCPYIAKTKCPYVKPFAYVYICPEQFDSEKLMNIQKLFNLFYQNFLMEKAIIIEHSKGVSKEKENNNKDRSSNAKTATDVLKELKYDGKDFCYDIIHCGLDNTLNTLKKQISDKFIINKFSNCEDVNKVINFLTKLKEICEKGNDKNTIGCAQIIKQIEQLENNMFTF